MTEWLQGLMIVLLFAGTAVSLVAVGLRRYYARSGAYRPAADVEYVSFDPPPPVSQTSAAGRPVDLLPHATWWPGVQQLPDRIPHTAVLGPSGAGKSALMEALARNRDDLLVVIQPNRKRGEWRGIPVAECDDDGGYTTIAAALAAIRAEFTRRGGAMKHGDPGPWLTIVWDEVPLCMRKLKDIAPDLVIDLLSAGRPRKMRAILGSTSDRVGALGIGGYGDLLESCAVIRLGAFAGALEPTTQQASYPTTLEIMGDTIPVERGPVLHLARTPVAPARIWQEPHAAATPPDAARMLRQALDIPPEAVETAPEISGPAESDFRASERDVPVSQDAPEIAEIALIAVGIAAGKGKTEILTSLPGYSGRRYKELAARYEQVKTVLDAPPVPR